MKQILWSALGSHVFTVHAFKMMLNWERREIDDLSNALKINFHLRTIKQYCIVQ